MDFASLIITPILETLIVLIKKHLGFLMSSTKHVKEMKMSMEKLNLKEQDVQEKKKRADANNHVVSHHVLPWLEDVKEMKKKVQIIPEGRIGCFNVVKKYIAGKQSYSVVEQKALKELESEIRWTDQQIPLAEVPSTKGARNDFHSRDLIFKRALNLLQPNNESHKMVALQGRS